MDGFRLNVGLYSISQGSTAKALFRVVVIAAYRLYKPMQDNLFQFWVLVDSAVLFQVSCLVFCVLWRLCLCLVSFYCWGDLWKSRTILIKSFFFFFFKLFFIFYNFSVLECFKFSISKTWFCLLFLCNIFVYAYCKACMLTFCVFSVLTYFCQFFLWCTFWVLNLQAYRKKKSILERN